MKQFLMITLALLVILPLLSSPFQATAQDEANPETVLRAIYDAINVGDVEGAMLYVADNAVLTIPPPPGSNGVFIGKEEIQGWWEQLVANGGRVEFTEFHTYGDKAVWTSAVYDEAVFVPWGVNPLYMDGVGVVKDGLMVAATWTFTDESLIRLEAAMAVEANKMLVNRFYEELWHEGNLDVADELLSEDFVSHAFPEGGVEELKAAVTGFRTDLPEGYFVIDDMIVTKDRAVVRGSAAPARPAEGEEPVRLDNWILLLGLKDGKITDRWVALVPETTNE